MDIMAIIDEILNDEQKAKLKEKLGDKTLIANDGNYIPRDRLNAKIEELKELQAQIGERDKQLKEISGKVTDNAELTSRIKELQALNDEQKTEYEGRLAKQKFDHTLDKALAEHKPRNPKAVRALLNMDAISLDGENLLGFAEQIKSLKESDAYLFGQETTTGAPAPRQPSQGAQTNRARLIEQYNEAEKKGNVAMMFSLESKIKKLKE